MTHITWDDGLNKNWLREFMPIDKHPNYMVLVEYFENIGHNEKRFNNLNILLKFIKWMIDNKYVIATNEMVDVFNLKIGEKNE